MNSSKSTSTKILQYKLPSIKTYANYSSISDLECDDETCNVSSPNSSFLGVSFSSPIIVFVIAGFVICLIIVSIISQSMQFSGCMPKPFIYVTRKDKTNILKISRNGCEISKKILWYANDLGQTAKLSNPSMRTMVVNAYKTSKDSLFVADADNDKVYIFGECSQFMGHGMRSYKTAAVTNVIGASHPYGIAFDHLGYLYVSYQNTNSILRYRLRDDTFQPYGSTAAGIHTIYENTSAVYDTRTSYANGTFIQFGYNSNKYGIGSDGGVRAIVWATSLVNGELMHNMWTAHEVNEMIYVTDIDGYVINKFKVPEPIGMHFNSASNLMYIGSRGSKKNGGVVISVDVTTKKIIRSYRLIGMSHPSGIVVDTDVLYVAEHATGQILTFNVTTTRYIKSIYQDDPDQIEDIILSNC